MDRRDKYVEPDKGKTKQYVCKENVILAKRGFTDEDINNFHTEYHLNNKDSQSMADIEKYLDTLPETLLKNLPKVKKERIPTFCEKCRIELEDKYPNVEWAMKHRAAVSDTVLDNLGHMCKNFDQYILSCMTYGVLNGLVKNRKEWRREWYQKTFNEKYYSYDAELNLIYEE